MYFIHKNQITLTQITKFIDSISGYGFDIDINSRGDICISGISLGTNSLGKINMLKDEYQSIGSAVQNIFIIKLNKNIFTDKSSMINLSKNLIYGTYICGYTNAKDFPQTPIYTEVSGKFIPIIVNISSQIEVIYYYNKTNKYRTII